jgi:hypothetical protein
MFGIGGNKERSLVETIASVDGGEVSKLPDDLQIRFQNILSSAQEYNNLCDICRTTKMPKAQRSAYYLQIDTIEFQMKELYRIAKVMHLGYSPFKLHEDYYIGGVENYVGGWRFDALLPPSLLARYSEAKKSKAFSQIVVASTDAGHFINPTPGKIDQQLMIGFATLREDRQPLFFFRNKQSDGEYVKGSQHKDFPGVLVKHAVSFLIP